MILRVVMNHGEIPFHYMCQSGWPEHICVSVTVKSPNFDTFPMYPTNFLKFIFNPSNWFEFLWDIVQEFLFDKKPCHPVSSIANWWELFSHNWIIKCWKSTFLSWPCCNSLLRFLSWAKNSLRFKVFTLYQ